MKTPERVPAASGKLGPTLASRLDWRWGLWKGHICQGPCRGRECDRDTG